MKITNQIKEIYDLENWNYFVNIKHKDSDFIFIINNLSFFIFYFISKLYNN